MKIKLGILLTFLSLNANATSFTPYLGLNGSFNQSKGINNEQDKQGPALIGKVLGSFEFDSSYLDLGLGYQWMDLEDDFIKINTRSVHAEIDYRFKLSNSWSLGPAIRVMSGADNTNSNSTGEDSSTILALGKLMYQTSFGSLPGRIEVAAGQSVGLDRTLTTTLLGIQVGFPWKKKTPSPPSNNIALPVVGPTTVIVKDVTKDRVEKADLKVDLKLARIRFDTNKSDISYRDEMKLAKLANFLAKNSSQWQRIKISGHTDITGDAIRNRQLSQDRALAVMTLFIKYGVDELKMSANGYGSAQPLDDGNSAEAYEKNRRTEIEFYGVQNRDEFNQKLIESLK